jgi:hypothetical protein
VAIFEATGHQRMRAIVYKTIGVVYAFKGEFDQALQYYQQNP